jgi:hypothetical protein
MPAFSARAGTRDMLGQHGDRPDFLIACRIREPATHVRDPFRAAELRLRRRRAKADQNFSIHNLDLAVREGQTGRRFEWGVGAVSRRPPGNDIGDIDRAAVASNCCQHLVEQLAGAPVTFQPIGIGSLFGSAKLVIPSIFFASQEFLGRPQHFIGAVRF